MESPARCRYAYYYVGDVLGHAQNGGNDLDKIMLLPWRVWDL